MSAPRFIVLLLVALTLVCAAAPGAWARADESDEDSAADVEESDDTDEEPRRRAVDSDEDMPRSGDDDRKPKSVERRSTDEPDDVEKVEPPRDPTMLNSAAAAGATSCAVLGLNWLGSGFVGGAIAAVLNLPIILTLNGCGFLLCFSPVIAVVVGTITHCIAAPVGTIAAALLSQYAVNLAGPRRVPGVKLLAASLVPTALLLALGLIIEVPLTFVAFSSGILVGYNLMYSSSVYRRTVNRQEALTYALVFGFSFAGAMLIPWLAVLVGNVIGVGITAVVAANSGRPMTAAESGWYDDTFDVPEPRGARRARAARKRVDDEDTERAPAPKKAKKKPARKKPPKPKPVEEPPPIKAAEPLDEPDKPGDEPMPREGPSTDEEEEETPESPVQPSNEPPPPSEPPAPITPVPDETPY